MGSIKITVDSREPQHIVALLLEMGAEVERKTITPADYVLSSECAIERKTVGDFFSSLFSGRLFEQVSSLKEAYQKPIFILEGDIENQLIRRRNPRAFWGAMMSLQIDMGIAVIPTPSVIHTANALYTLAKRLQKKKVDKITIQHKPRLMTNSDWQLYVVSSLPLIGDELASRMLSQFKTVRKIFQSQKKELQKVEGIGKIKAKRITQILDIEMD
jgi:ERCC4-type nuclease